MKKLIMFGLLAYISQANGLVLPSIPAHLLPCYRGGGPTLSAPRRLDVFLSVLKKLESNSQQFDLRVFSGAILRSLRLDGIEEAANGVETEFMLPYRASSFQFHKYKLLMDLFIPSHDVLEIDDILSLEEKCLLHTMLSSTVRRWERGDESLVCPLSVEQGQSVTVQGSVRVHSRCPIEQGIIQTEWGTISPGTLISAIASGLESQRVLVTDVLNANIYKDGIAEPLMTSAKQEWFEDIETLDRNVTNGRQTDTADIGNVWVATLAGNSGATCDLAEVVINQGPRVGPHPQKLVIGSNNKWNDTLLPRIHYLFAQNSDITDWHYTDAEMLAGIDGFILANYVASWVEQRRTLRLSQIIDMYYSNEGVSFDPKIMACNRQTLFTELLQRSQLVSETSRFAHVLSLRQITVYIPVEEMNRITEAAVTAFLTYAPTLFKQYNTDCKKSKKLPSIDLIMATDSSWKGYTVEQFMSWIGGALEVDRQSSTIGLLHGNTGQWIVAPSRNMSTLFSILSNYTDEYPNRLNLPNVMGTVLEHSRNKTLHEIATNVSAAISTVVLIVSPSDKPSSNDIDRARDVMSSIKKSFFDVYFAYAVSELAEFQDINNEYLDYSELFFKTPSTKIQDVIDVVDTYLVGDFLPTRMVGPQCPFNGTLYEQVEFEDSVLPGRYKMYRIHPFYLRLQSMVQVQFRNDGQGQLQVCMWRGADASHTCTSIIERGITNFNLTSPCQSPEFCIPAHFTVTAVTTSNLCAHNECRQPDQVGFYLKHSGLRCLPLLGAAWKPESLWNVEVLAVVISLIVLR